MPQDRRRVAPPLRRASAWISPLVFALAALGAVQFYRPPQERIQAPPQLVVASLPFVAPSPNAFGESGELRVRFALPGQRVEYPLQVGGDPSALMYQWIRVVDTTSSDTSSAETPAPLSGAEVIAPSEPGFYRLALLVAGERQLVDELTLAVLVPFSEKLGATLNGYRIGTYLAERLGGSDRERPEGFVEIGPDEVDLPLSTHLRVADFITHDGQDTWPRYAALNPRLLDKLELVIAEVSRRRGGSERVGVQVAVHSGFRTPSYNRRIHRAANDSRHQYGDAADVSIDANGDGRVSGLDSRLVGIAVERVEREHPELVGGLGVYNRGGGSYVHIDARGRRVRWTG